MRRDFVCGQLSIGGPATWRRVVPGKNQSIIFNELTRRNAGFGRVRGRESELAGFKLRAEFRSKGLAASGKAAKRAQKMLLDGEFVNSLYMHVYAE